MEQDREEQRHRLTNKKKSNAAKLAWKRNHGNYVAGIRKRERESMKKSFYDICRDMDEANITRDNIFENKLNISFDNIAGGVSLSINDDEGTLSISTSLDTTGVGQYGLSDFDNETLKTLFSNVKEDLLNLCKNFDNEIIQIITKNGLKSTK